MKKQINTVFLEDDYSKFKQLQGNRVVEPSRVKKIIKSIKSVGLIECPIVCNEKMEVIDGQGRLAACQQLGLPVPYMVIEGLEIETCRAMNIHQENWGLIDYIRSFADKGSESFARLLFFTEESGFSLSTSLSIATAKCPRSISEEVKSGSLEFTEEDLDKAINIAEYLHRFDDIRTNRRAELYKAIQTIIEIPEVDNERLVAKIHQSPRSFEQIATVLDAVGVIDDVYNNRLRNHVYIETEYLKILDKRRILKMLSGKQNSTGDNYRRALEKNRESLF